MLNPLIDLIRAGKAHVTWGEVVSEHNGHRLRIKVFADAMRFDGVPPMDWSRRPIPAKMIKVGDPTSYDGVRLPATAYELQEIADLLGCMLLTPKVLDLIWQQAARRYDCIVAVKGKIVAETPIHLLHQEIEKKLATLGGDPDSIVASVGKYWVMSNRLVQTPTFGSATACNYGWHSSGGRYPAVTKGLRVFQSEGTRHNHLHRDPSQVVKLMARTAYLTRAGSSMEEEIDLHVVAKDKDLCGLINHNGILHVLRMPGVPSPKPVTNSDGSITLPELIIL